MAAGDFHIGLKGQFYYGAAGAEATTLTNNVSEVKASGSVTMAKATPRGRTIEGSKPIKKVVKITCKTWDIETDAFFIALRSAWINHTKIAIFAKDRSGGEGFDGDFYVADFDEEQDDEGIIFRNVGFEPAIDGREPIWH